MSVKIKISHWDICTNEGVILVNNNKKSSSQRLVRIRDMREKKSGFISSIFFFIIAPIKTLRRCTSKDADWAIRGGFRSLRAGILTAGLAETPFWLQTTAPELCWRKESCSWCLRKSQVQLNCECRCFGTVWDGLESAFVTLPPCSWQREMR